MHPFWHPRGYFWHDLGTLAAPWGTMHYLPHTFLTTGDKTMTSGRFSPSPPRPKMEPAGIILAVLFEKCTYDVSDSDVNTSHVVCRLLVAF